jgi:hypothetical protein
MKSNKIKYTIYIIQAKLAVDPLNPEWSDVAIWAVPGHTNWDCSEYRITNIGGRFYSDCLVFSNPDTGLDALRDAKTVLPVGREKRYEFRLMKRSILITQQEVVDNSTSERFCLTMD